MYQTTETENLIESINEFMRKNDMNMAEFSRRSGIHYKVLLDWMNGRVHSIARKTFDRATQYMNRYDHAASIRTMATETRKKKTVPVTQEMGNPAEVLQKIYALNLPADLELRVLKLVLTSLYPTPQS